MREGECPSRCLIHEYLDIYLGFFCFYSHIGYYGVLRRVPYALQWVLVDDFIKSSVCMLI